MLKIILASKSKVRKKILDKNNIFNEFIYDIFIELVFNQIVVNES